MVAEKFVLSLETLSSLGFEERSLVCPGNVAGCPGSLGVFKKFVPKKFVRIFRSLSSEDFQNSQFGAPAVSAHVWVFPRFETVWAISLKLNVQTCCTGNWRCESNSDLN